MWYTNHISTFSKEGFMLNLRFKFIFYSQQTVILLQLLPHGLHRRAAQVHNLCAHHQLQ